jgi:hypothetical protein
MRKRVLLQVAWSKGCSIFGYKTRSLQEEHTKQEIVELYRQLAIYVMEQAREADRA